jgi:hypothetical protein
MDKAARTVEFESATPPSGFKRWLLKGYIQEIEGPHEPEGRHPAHPWWQVMCLTGVDYFSTLGYQPGIAALAAGALAPIATLVLVLLTLFGALPMYRRVAGVSPHGDGSVSMLEHLLPWWQGKLFVLSLIGFAATGFIITITLSAADATAHIVENPFAPHWMEGQEVLLTLGLIALLGAVFLKGFGEAIGIAVVLAATYIGLTGVIVVRGFQELLHHPEFLSNWSTALFHQHASPLAMIGAALLVFPKLALGLSGFETGVVVMPLIKGQPGDTEEHPEGRIRNARKLLTAAALIMSVMLISSSFVTVTLIPAEAFRGGAPGIAAGEANGRALAFLAHHLLGHGFGTVYDLSTILILWFAGASAMAGLLNIVPRYLPRYGMAPEWTRATRPLVLIFTAICFAITFLFKADVEAQAGAYATGVLALMTSATVAVTIQARQRREKGALLWFGLVALIFIYTTLVNIIEQPEGLRIALFFIATIVFTSLLSRAWRSLELRVERIELDDRARQMIEEEVARDGIRIVANKRQAGDELEYELKAKEQYEANAIPVGTKVLFLEVEITESSEFTHEVRIRGVDVEGYHVLRAEAPSVPNAIAAFLMYLRDTTGKRPHCYFSWSEGDPLWHMFRYIVFGQGDTAPLTREVIRRAERNPVRRPVIHVGG